jgi:hypothetical protein
MFNHPFVSDLSGENMEQLGEKIATLNTRMQWAFKMGKHDMVRQMQMVLESYKAEYAKQQNEMWAKRGNSSPKIDIS